MRIPEVRERLAAIAEEQANLLGHVWLLAKDVFELTEELKRRPCVRRVGKRLATLTPEQRAGIVAHFVSHPDDSYIDIAKVFHTSIGRVSECVAGRRT